MASHFQLLAIIITYITLTHHTNCETIQCPNGATECNCLKIIDKPQPCVLICDSTDICKKTTLNCRAGDSCSIQCSGYASCFDATINASSATDFSLTCDGDNACRQIETNCGTGQCTLQCNTHQKSCFDIGSFDAIHATSFQCNGFCPNDNIIPIPFALPTAPPTTFMPTPSPTIPPSINTITPTLYPTNIPTIITLNPTITPTIYPTLNPSFYPTYYPSTPPTYNPSKSPTKLPTNKPTRTPIHTPTKSPSNLHILATRDQVVPSSLDSTDFVSLKPTIGEKESSLSHTLVLTHTCYIIIGICVAIILCVCCLAFCLIYLTHRHTQSLLIAATNTYFANSNGTTQDNKFYRNGPSPHIHNHNQVNTPSIILNPYQLPGIYDASIINNNQINNHINQPFGTPKLTPHINSAMNQSYPPPIMVSNINATNKAVSPNHNNMNNMHMNDAMSAISNSHGDEGTVGNRYRHRNIADIPALPQQVSSDTVIHRKESLSPQIPQRHHRHRTSLHMTPAGYMDEKFVTKKKKSDDSTVLPATNTNSNVMGKCNDANSNVNTPNTRHRHSYRGSTLTGIAEHAIEILKLGENANDCMVLNSKPSETHISIYDERKSIDVDQIEIDLDNNHHNNKNNNNVTAMGVNNIEINEMNDETDTDLSKELFATHSPSLSSIKRQAIPDMKAAAKNKSNSKSKNNPFYQYHVIGSLPVIISPNNQEYKHKQQQQMDKTEHIRSNTDNLHVNINNNNANDDINYELILNNNNIIAPLKEYNNEMDDMSEYSNHSNHSKQSKQSKHNIQVIHNKMSTCTDDSESTYDENESTYSSSHSHVNINHVNNNQNSNNKYETSPSNTYTMHTRYTKPTQSMISDVDSNDLNYANSNNQIDDDDDDTYNDETRAVSASTISTISIISTIKSDTKSDYEFVIYPSHIPPPAHINDDISNDINTNDDSETSATNHFQVDDEIILQHANKLMNLLDDENENNNLHRNVYGNSISIQV